MDVKEGYVEEYIDCYNMVLDIIELVQNFIFPDKYKINRLKDDLTSEEKLALIKKDLESVRFQKQIFGVLLRVLENYFPDNASKKIIIFNKKDKLQNQEIFEISFKLEYVYNQLKNIYLPFIKLAEINQERNSDPQGDYSEDNELWQYILESSVSLRYMLIRINKTIKDLLENEGNYIDSHLKSVYNLNDIQFNRFMNGENNPYSSIEMAKLQQPDSSKVTIDANFEKFDEIFKDIVGQDGAIREIRNSLFTSLQLYNSKDLGKTSQNKVSNGPLATFLFYGPTGTGKTEVAKLIADFVFGSRDSFLLLDMNTYKDDRAASSAIKGNPEGYVDSKKGTDFTRFLKRNKRGVIVLDEFEKAPKDVREIFMTMLDEGYLRDSLGNIYDLSSFVFIATTNVSKVFENRKMKIGFVSETKRQKEDDILDRLRDEFSSPILNRFNEIIEFKKIKYEDAKCICTNLINQTIFMVENREFNGIVPKIKIENLDRVVEIILSESNFEKDGVRNLKRYIKGSFLRIILEEVAKEKCCDVFIGAKEGNIIVSSNTKAKVIK